MTALSWGRRYLMCRPEYFEVAYEINPWMHRAIAADRDKAQLQWDNLAATLQAAGATVELQPPVDGLPDLVFTANVGLVSGERFVPAQFRHPERQGETEWDTAWFVARGYGIELLPADVVLEGAGDALAFGGTIVAGYRTRSDIASHAALSRLLGVPVRSIELTDERLYHLDLTFCPLDDRRAIVAPAGWDDYGVRALQALVPEPLVLGKEDTFAFCANSVVVGTTVVMPSCSVSIGRQLEAWGFDVVVCQVDEFLKAGGGCRCLTLAVDVDLSGG